MDTPPAPAPRPLPPSRTGAPSDLERIEDKLDYLIERGRHVESVLGRFAGLVDKFAHLLPSSGSVGFRRRKS